MNNFYGLIYFIFLIFIIPLIGDYTRAHPTRICSIGNGTERWWWVAFLARVRNMDGLVTSAAAAAAPFPQWNTWNWWCKSEEAKIKWHKACKKGTRSRSSRLSLTLRSDAPLASSTVRTGCSTSVRWFRSCSNALAHGRNLSSLSLFSVRSFYEWHQVSQGSTDSRVCTRRRQLIIIWMKSGFR